MQELEKFLTERHDLSEHTKEQYRMAFKALSKHTNHAFSLNREEMNTCLEQLAGDLKPSSWNAYVVCIKAWYKWRYGNDEEYPDAVKKVKLKRIRREDYIKTKILSEDEIKALLRAAEHPRDRAFIAVAACTGARRGELLNLRIRDVVVKPYGYDLVLTGKTGTHPSPPVIKDFAKILRVWLEHHPLRNDPEAPLWIRLKDSASGSRFEPLRTTGAHYLIKKAMKNANMNRNIHLHMLRHTENTDETRRRVPAVARKKLHGWSSTSNVPSIYEHLTDEDSVKAVLQSHGIEKPEEEKDSFEPVKCGYCGHENASISKYCQYCGVPLMEEEAQKLVVRRAEQQEKLEALLKRVESLETKLDQK